jgi:hypothetical protein
MSHVVLRRVMVRLLHDPGFVRALHDDPDRALAGLDLDGDERRWLLATPPEAWCADAERPARVLAGLREEYPAATRLAPERLQDFFAAPAFHGAVQQRGSLAAALGAHLAAHPDARVSGVARLEAAIAAVRRSPPDAAAPAPGTIALRPHATLVAVPAGTLAWREALRTGSPEPPAPDGEEHLLVLRDADGSVAVQEVPDALAELLRVADGGVPRPVLLAAARAHGAEAGEDAEIVDELVADGILVRGPDGRRA